MGFFVRIFFQMRIFEIFFEKALIGPSDGTRSKAFVHIDSLCHSSNHSLNSEYFMS